MAKQNFKLNKDEKIVYKVSCVRHGFWGAYTHSLVVTNQSVILEKFGLFNNYKGIERYNYSDINQAIQGQASNGEKQLELYIGGKVEDFALQSGDKNALRVLVMAINDQMSSDSADYDFQYYQNILNGVENRVKNIESKAIEKKIANKIENVDISKGLSVAGEVAKNVIKSKDFSVKGVTKGIRKATGKKRSVFGKFKDELFDDLGIYDIQDTFTEFGNDIRETFGFKPKMTNEERLELEEKEERKREQQKAKEKRDLEKQKNAAFDEQVKAQKEEIKLKKEKLHKEELEKENNKSKEANSINEVNEQFEALKKAKELLDEGILTQEEFEIKKKEILKLGNN